MYRYVLMVHQHSAIVGGPSTLAITGPSTLAKLIKISQSGAGAFLKLGNNCLFTLFLFLT